MDLLFVTFELCPNYRIKCSYSLKTYLWSSTGWSVLCAQLSIDENCLQNHPHHHLGLTYQTPSCGRIYLVFCYFTAASPWHSSIGRSDHPFPMRKTAAHLLTPRQPFMLLTISTFCQISQSRASIKISLASQLIFG